MPKHREYMPSPRVTLIPKLSDEEAAAMAYPPNAIPGGRDDNPGGGTMRIYEWGPEEGRKVLFVPGNTLPCPIFANTAQSLVDSGCRVMLYDSWGTGYSDTPLNRPHDVKLLETQIYWALYSSPLTWIQDGIGNFSIVAESSGALVAFEFILNSPLAVQSLVLIKPTGLIVQTPDGLFDELMQHRESAPSPAIRELVRRIWGVDRTKLSKLLPMKRKSKESNELVKYPSRVERTFEIEDLVQWQFDYHLGYTHTVQSTVCFGPLWGTQAAGLWKQIGDIFAGRECRDSPLSGNAMLVILEKENVWASALRVENLSKVVPDDCVWVHYLSSSSEIPSTLLTFWGLAV